MAYVYIMTHKPTEQCYVGSGGGGLTSRFAGHIRMLKSGIHYNSRLQELWSGDISEWVFQILEDGISSDIITDREYIQWEKRKEYSVNLEPPKRKRIRMYADLYKEVQSGMTYRAVAEKHNVAVGTVGNAVRALKR